jgi:hypothetical protein
VEHKNHKIKNLVQEIDELRTGMDNSKEILIHRAQVAEEELRQYKVT